MIERLPESWIAPDHILDLPARVRLRHTLSVAAREQVTVALEMIDTIDRQLAPLDRTPS